MFPSLVEHHIRQSIGLALRVLYPTVPDIGSLVKPHHWRDRRYVGESGGVVLAWKGLSANMQRADSRMRTVYVDLVPHQYDLHDAVSLFGTTFADRLRATGPAVVTFVLDFPHDARVQIERCGFVPRVIGRKLHACVVDGVDDYLAGNPASHASRIIELLMFQRALANQRRTVTGVELRFQHLLYQSGFLAGYLLGQSLEVLEVASPRRAGEFGHDIDARVRLRGRDTTYRLGIEVFLRQLGYHRESIPEYAERFRLNAVMVVAPRDPWPELADAFAARGIVARKIGHLSQLDGGDGVGIHHLGLSRVIDRLARTAESIEAIRPTAPLSSSSGA